MFPPSAVGTSEITITIHHGPVMHQMRVGLLALGMSPPIPTYNSVPAAQAVSFPTTTRAPGAATRLVADRPWVTENGAVLLAGLLENERTRCSRRQLMSHLQRHNHGRSCTGDRSDGRI
jgi:hypothetical protein